MTKPLHDEGLVEGLRAIQAHQKITVAGDAAAEIERLSSLLAEERVAALRYALLVYWGDDHCEYDSDTATSGNDYNGDEQEPGSCDCRAHVAYRALVESGGTDV